MSRLVIVLECDNRQFATVRHAFTQRLDIIRAAIREGVVFGELAATPESRVSGVWHLNLGDDEEPQP